MTIDNQGPPHLVPGQNNQPEVTSIGILVEWFLDYDRRVAVIRSADIEEIFQWKQSEAARANENAFTFNHAEDRLVIGIIQALSLYTTEPDLHEWITQLLDALDDATKTIGEISSEYDLQVGAERSTLRESAMIPQQQAREIFLNCSWLQALCTAEIRVLGWVYLELYKKAFAATPLHAV